MEKSQHQGQTLNDHSSSKTMSGDLFTEEKLSNENSQETVFSARKLREAVSKSSYNVKNVPLS